MAMDLRIGGWSRLCLHNQGADSETPWAEDLGPADGEGARRVRLDNVPFLHAKPTYGDELIVTPNADGVLAWDRGGLPWERIDERIAQDGGRYVMIVDYLPAASAEVQATFQSLCDAASAIGGTSEGCFPPKDSRPGRMYVAMPDATEVGEVMKALDGAATGAALTLVHPQ